MPTTCPAVEIGDAAVIVCVAFSFESRDANFANPKSSTFTRPSCVTITFAGLRSRCTTPPWCAATSASASGIARSSTRGSGRPPAITSRSRLCPSISSIVRNRIPSTSSIEKRVTMFGWLKAATVLASRSNRARRSGCDARSSGSTFTATSLPSRGSRARYTSPMPPSPSRATIS